MMTVDSRVETINLERQQSKFEKNIRNKENKDFEIEKDATNCGNANEDDFEANSC